MSSFQDEPLDLAPLIARVATAACGAIVTFLGIVRERSAGDPRSVAALEYQTYRVMSVPELQAIVLEAEGRFAGARVAIVHRLGKVLLGEASVGVVAAAPHRAAAFDACEYAIDELKRRVPIWKREWYVDGDARWREETMLEAPGARPPADGAAPSP